jgi:hypothetical protein
LRKILKRFEGISSEGDILQCFEGKKDVNKVINEEGRCMIATSFPLYVHKLNMPIPTLVNYKLHINKFENPIGAWLESVLSKTSTS